jgi:hypothetical protein
MARNFNNQDPYEGEGFTIVMICDQLTLEEVDRRIKEACAKLDTTEEGEDLECNDIDGYDDSSENDEALRPLPVGMLHKLENRPRFLTAEGSNTPN